GCGGGGLGEGGGGGGAEGGEGGEGRGVIGKLRALQPHLERALHLAARPGNDSVVDAALIGVEFGVDDLGRAGHGGTVLLLRRLPYAIAREGGSRMDSPTAGALTFSVMTFFSIALPLSLLLLASYVFPKP